MLSSATAVAGAASILALLALSAFFSASKTAIFSLPPPEASPAAAGPGVRTLAALRADPHRLLVTILVGNNLVNVAISSIATVLLVSAPPTGLAVAATTVGVTSLVLVVGEIVPKAYGLGNAERWSLRVARSLSVVGRLLWPIVVVFDAVTRRLAALIGGDSDVEEQYHS